MAGPVDSMVVCPLTHLLQCKMVLLVKIYVTKDSMMVSQVFCEPLDGGTGGGGVNSGQEEQVHKQNLCQSQWGDITASYRVEALI